MVSNHASGLNSSKAFVLHSFTPVHAILRAARGDTARCCSVIRLLAHPHNKETQGSMESVGMHIGIFATASHAQLCSPALLRMLLIVAAFALNACNKPPGPPAKGPSHVTFITVAARDTPVFMEFVAQTQSSRQVNIQARVNGFLDKRVYTEGSMVKEGQVLFLMDKKPFVAQLDQAKAALQRQQAAMKVAQQ